MKRFLVIGILATAIVLGVTYYLFQSKIDEAKEHINEQSITNKHEFLSKKNFYLKRFTNEHPNKKSLFNDYFDVRKAKYLEDTLISLFVYKKHLSISSYDTVYYSCLLNKCNAIIQNQEVENEIKSRINSLVSDYGAQVNNWFADFGKDRFININYGDTSCNDYFAHDSSYTINQSAFSEFNNFLTQYNNDINKYQRLSNQAQTKYKSKVNSARRNLSRNDETFFIDKINKSSFVVKRNEKLQYTGDILGSINYFIERLYFKEDTFSSMVDNIYADIYKDNKLRSGSAPYAGCYGYNKDCSGYNCSNIKVVTSSSSDVVVTIKKNDRVIRHAYIRANNSYTFDLPNGRYQTFFYYGKGWNPHKIINQGRCGMLKGGFVMNEDVGKDDPQYLNSQILTYELIRQQFGNFSTKPSNKMEAF